MEEVEREGEMHDESIEERKVKDMEAGEEELKVGKEREGVEEMEEGVEGTASEAHPFTSAPVEIVIPRMDYSPSKIIRKKSSLAALAKRRRPKRLRCKPLISARPDKDLLPISSVAKLGMTPVIMDLSLAESSPELHVADVCEPAAKKARRVHFSEDVPEDVSPVTGTLKGKKKRKKTKGKSGMKHRGKGRFVF